ncbi:carboxypeptidase regulatory-like domain-containing protein [Silvibacterium acidisoli]|uniref:carboxypeptidase regulatory-like domain-containing protein n=1 Tax=Acidobacteriaceae bacterium ZG23-2 TaxID=2883246 RepID=UPI00406C0C10
MNKPVTRHALPCGIDSRRDRKGLRASIAALFLSLTLLGGAVGVSSRTAYAQNTTSSISGTVTDPSGAILPNAKVKVVNSATGQTFNITTNAQGSYTITNIQPGSYNVSASADGFQGQTLSNVNVDANIGRQVNFAMKVGNTGETVTVEANANALQTESAVVGQTVTQDQVKSIQLNGRNPIYLSQLEPGVTRNAPLSSFNFAPDFGGPQISGARNDEIAITLDGAPMIRTRGNGTTTGVPDVDSIAQMQILSTNYPAQYGGTSGGVLVQVPRTGTRDFHGSVFEYLRNSFFDANTWFNKSQANPAVADHPTPFRYNQFGWNVNGPVAIPHVSEGLRNKLFFLVGQEYLRYRQSPTQSGTVPTALMRGGDFSELLVPGNLYTGAKTVITNPTTGQAYVNNVIPQNQLSPNGIALLNAYPAANANGANYNWVDQAAYPQNQRKDTVTLDYLPAANQQIRFSFLHYTFNQISPFSGNFNRTPQAWNWPDEVGVLHWTWTISPTTVNDLTASASADHVTINVDQSSGLYNRDNYGINFPYLFPASEKEITNKIPTIEPQGFTTLDGGPYPSHSGGIVYTVADNVTKIMGKHTLNFGGLWMYSGENDNDQIDVSSTTPGATDNQNGQFIFTALRNHAATSGAGISNAALGLFDSYGEIGQKSYTLFRANSAEFFAQDTWHVNSKLVVEYGARYSIFQPFYALWRNQSMFNPKYYVPGDAPVVDPVTGTETGGLQYDGMVIPGKAFPNSAQGHLNPVVLTGAYNYLFHNTSKSYSPTVWSNIQPRIGITDQLTPTTVVRLGGGRFVQRLGVNDSIQLGGNAPFQQAESVTNGNVDNPGGTTVATYPAQVSSQAYDYPSPEAWSWSAAVEQDIPKFATATISYVGRRGIHLQQLENINQLTPGTVQANPGIQEDALRPYQGYSSIVEQSDRGGSNYNAMQVELKRRFTNNFLFGVSYTWAKLLDYGSGRGYELPDYRQPGLNYGPADFDLRNVLVVDYVWTVPYGAHLDNRVARYALSDWQVSGVTQAQDGPPLNSIYVSGADDAGVGVGAGSQLWVANQKPHVGKHFGSGGWFDGADFSEPAQGTLAPRGTRNIIYGPGFQSWNIALQKPFKIFPGHDNHTLTFRAEAFNFPNHPNWDTPNQTPGTGTFGEVTTKGQTYSSDREMQFSLRYAF